jgi:dolichol kinase
MVSKCKTNKQALKALSAFLSRMMREDEKHRQCSEFIYFAGCPYLPLVQRSIKKTKILRY